MLLDWTAANIYVDRANSALDTSAPDYNYHMTVQLAGIPPLGYRITIPEEDNGATTYRSYSVVEGAMQPGERCITLYCRRV